ncbi:MAG: NAD-glutamate dehydrogenase, partial [Xanthomonadales bacterium]|nr:NAD-glutamate dehydrogenase [Xanthomonadales bacterium]
EEAIAYFPTPLRERFQPFMSEHRLSREIIATQVTNSLANRMGASFALRMNEDTGASPGEVARAYSIAREVFDARGFWRRIEALDNKVSSELQLQAMLAMWRLLRQATRWLLNLEGRRLDIRQMVDRLAPGLKLVARAIRRDLPAEEVESLHQQMQPYTEGGFPAALAEQTAMLDRLFPALDVVETAARRRTDVTRVARVFFGLADRLELAWLRRQVEGLVVIGRWHALSRAGLRDELFSQHNRLVECVLRSAGRKRDPVGAWLAENEAQVRELTKMLTNMKDHGEMDYATLSVAVRALGELGAEPRP